MFDAIKKAQAVEALAREVGALVDRFLHQDANKNGVSDGIEILNELKEMPALIEKEGSEIVAEALDAKHKIEEKTRKIVKLIGDDVNGIQAEAKAEIADILKRIEQLRK